MSFLSRDVRGERGAVLLTALLVLVAVLAIGAAAAHTALNAEKSARSERDRHIAMQAAEAGLIDAERDIEGGADPASARALLFAGGSALGFAAGCGRGENSVNLGLCTYTPDAPAWQSVDLAAANNASGAAVPYGRFTGAALPTGGGALPGRPPRYVIELMPLARAGEDAGQAAANVYRITAIGFGVRPSTQVVLQTFYRKVDSAAGSLRAANPQSEWTATTGVLAGVGLTNAVNRAGRASTACRRTVVAGKRPGGAGVLIESSFEAAGWSGQLAMRALATAGGDIAIGATLWEAGAILTGPPPRPAPRDRKIFTLLRSSDGSTTSIPFRWEQLGDEDRSWLDLAPPGELADGLGEARVDYLRGERGREIGQPDGIFRRRTSVLGDAIHGTPLLVGAPSLAAQGPGYDDFHARYKARAEAIYLGANDGMLHAFDARDGAELFAYVPNALIPFLGQLGDPDYRHRPYVDASAGQGEAMLDGRWRSVLVSGMGTGARGVFALDISDPGAFEDGERALWEFTEKDDPAIGHVSAAPLVARIRVGATQYRYFALVASGVDNNAQEAGNTDGALFLLALDKPPTERWQRDVNYYKLAAPSAIPGLANALGQPAPVTAADGSVRYAYAGDLQGTLWRFDFSGKPPFASGRLFEALDDSGQRQPIAQAPRVVFAPGGGYLVLFGTGKPFEEEDEFAPQSLYAVKDSAAVPVAQVHGRSELARRTLTGDAAYNIEGDDFAYAGAGAKNGWYFDFPNARIDGERLAATPALVSGAVFVSTVVRGAGPCGAGFSRTYVLDALTGFVLPANGGTTGRLVKGSAVLPLLLELGVATGPRNATGGAGAIRNIGIVNLQENGAAPAVQHVGVSLPARRISWREVANWQELHEAAKK